MKKAIKVLATVLAVVLCASYSSSCMAVEITNDTTIAGTTEIYELVLNSGVTLTVTGALTLTGSEASIRGTIIVTSGGSLTSTMWIFGLSDSGALYLDYGSSYSLGTVDGSGTIWYEVSNDLGLTVSCEEGSYTTYGDKTYVKEGTTLTVSGFDTCYTLSVHDNDGDDVNLDENSFTIYSPVIFSLTHGTTMLLPVGERSANCTVKGCKAHYFCEGCEKYFVDADAEEEISLEDLVIAKLTHCVDLTKVDQVDATCTKEGCKAYYYCKVCEKIYADEEAEEETELEDLVIATLDHSYSNGVCTVCGYGTSTTATSTTTSTATATTTPTTTATTATTTTTTTTSTTSEQVAESSPKTGEGSFVYLLLASAFVSVAGIGVARKKRF